jgi:hypothetical protein
MSLINMNVLDLPSDVWGLIFKHLNLNDLHELSCCDKELNKYIHEFARDNASKANQNSSSQILWTVLRKNFAENNLLGKRLVEIASSVIGKQASALNQTVEISGETLKISVSGTELITLHSFAQATYLYTYYGCEPSYDSFWESLRLQRRDLPDLKGRSAISAWLEDPQNQAVLGSITSLKITGPEFIFFPPEAKSRLTALQALFFSDCTSLKTLNFEGRLTLQRVCFFSCTSLQAFSFAGCPAAYSIQLQ